MPAVELLMPPRDEKFIGQRRAVAFLRRDARGKRIEHTVRATARRWQLQQFERAEREIERDHREGDQPGAILFQTHPGALPAFVARAGAEQKDDEPEGAQHQCILHQPMFGKADQRFGHESRMRGSASA